MPSGLVPTSTAPYGMTTAAAGFPHKPESRKNITTATIARKGATLHRTATGLIRSTTGRGRMIRGTTTVITITVRWTAAQPRPTHRQGAAATEERAQTRALVALVADVAETKP